MALDQYSTHSPILAAVMMIAPPGDVIEFGVGGYSTPLLHGLCKLQGRNLVSIDSNETWAKELAWYAVGNHALIVTKDPHAHPMVTTRKWSVAFVDNGQYEREPCIKILANRCDILVVHDTERPDLYGYEPLLSDAFSNRVDLITRPWKVKTSVLSNSQNLDKIRDMWK